MYMLTCNQLKEGEINVTYGLTKQDDKVYIKVYGFKKSDSPENLQLENLIASTKENPASNSNSFSDEITLDKSDFPVMFLLATYDPGKNESFSFSVDCVSHKLVLEKKN